MGLKKKKKSEANYCIVGVIIPKKRTLMGGSQLESRLLIPWSVISHFLGLGEISRVVWAGRQYLDSAAVFFSFSTNINDMSGIWDQEVTGISLGGSSWPLTNYLIKLHSNTFCRLFGSALLAEVKRTEWTQNPSSIRDPGEVIAACCCFPVGGSWGGRGGGSINPL